MSADKSRAASSIRSAIESIKAKRREPVAWESVNIQDAIEYLHRGWCLAAESSANLAMVDESVRSPHFPRTDQVPLGCEELNDMLSRVENNLSPWKQ